uniref:Uncharacterized protein n=1 Tax=Onchocerca volvulus TaxID=6282 RepID=A0A2K6WDX1_ONCVO
MECFQHTACETYYSPFQISGRSIHEVLLPKHNYVHGHSNCYIFHTFVDFQYHSVIHLNSSSLQELLFIGEICSQINMLLLYYFAVTVSSSYIAEVIAPGAIFQSKRK